MLAGVQPFTTAIAQAVDDYCASHSTPLPEELIEHKSWTAANFECPEVMSSTLQAHFFAFLASDSRACRVLDIGAFSGYSALAWKKGMEGVGGEVWTLENDPVMSEACHAALKRYDQDNKIHLVTGSAIETLQRIDGPFDIIYMDANKAEYIGYLNIILDRALLAPTGIILADDGRFLQLNLIRAFAEETTAVSRSCGGL